MDKNIYYAHLNKFWESQKTMTNRFNSFFFPERKEKKKQVSFLLLN